jgi:hypothetical protein
MGSAFARLRSGVTREASGTPRVDSAQIRAIFPWWRPDAWGVGARLTELRDRVR